MTQPNTTSAVTFDAQREINALRTNGVDRNIAVLVHTLNQMSIITTSSGDDGRFRNTPGPWVAFDGQADIDKKMQHLSAVINSYNRNPSVLQWKLDTTHPRILYVTTSFYFNQDMLRRMQEDVAHFAGYLSTRPFRVND